MKPWAIKHRKSVAALADELFKAVESVQGYGFVSDGLNACTSHAQLFGIIRTHQYHTEVAARRMRAFLKKYQEL